MRTVNILVEGLDDIIFLRRLVEVMREQRGVDPKLRWALLNVNHTATIGSGKFGNCAVSMPTGAVIAIMDTGGVYGSGHPPTYDNPALMQVKLPNRAYAVTDIVGIFDADSPNNFLGNPVPYGGKRDRSEYVNKMLSRLGIGYKFFLLPDNGGNGSMESLAMRFVSPSLRFELLQNWPAFRNQLKSDLTSKGIASYPYSEKCTLAQFSTVHDLESAKDLYWLASLWNPNMWDWNAVALDPLKTFLLSSVPELFR